MNCIEDAYKRFNTDRFSLPREEQVAQLEQHLGIRFPEDYRQFILEFNGGYFRDPEIAPIIPDYPQDALASLRGLNPSHPYAELGSEWDLSLFDDNDPLELLPIGDTVLGGLLLLVTHPEERGTILLKEAFGDAFFLAEGIEEFFSLLREPHVEE